MTGFLSTESASRQRVRRNQNEQYDLDDGPATRRMHFVWRTLWWILIVNMLLFLGLTGAVALL